RSRHHDEPAAPEIAALPGGLDIAQWDLYHVEGQLAGLGQRHDLAIHLLHVLWSEPFGRAVDLDPGGAQALRGENDPAAGGLADLDQPGRLGEGARLWGRRAQQNLGGSAPEV